MMLADLPPNSSTQGITRSAAALAMSAPVAGEPTKITFFTDQVAMACGTMLWPRPASTLTSPTGRPACSPRRAMASDENGVSSEGLSSTALPVASAGPSCQPQVKAGAFHGVICSTVP